MSVIAIEILIILILVFINGLFAMSELAVVSARKVRLQRLAKKGDTRAKAALELAGSPNRFLSTIQIGITLVGVLAGAFGGATIAEQIAARLNSIPALIPYSEAIGIGLVVLFITYLSLIIGELVPKNLALNNAEKIALIVARPMTMLLRIASPVVHLLSFSTEAGLRLLRVRPSEEPPITQEEIRIMIEQGTQAGIFDEAEQDMVNSIFRLGDRRVEELMVPRPRIVALNIDTLQQENWRKMAASGHIFFPVYRGNLDNIMGIVSVKDLWDRMTLDQSTDLKDTLLKPLMVPETMPALKVLEMFRQTDMQIALVVDEHGGIQGIVTLIDIMEAIVGDIPLINDPSHPEAVRREDGSWLLDGMLSIEEFSEILDIKELPEEAGDYYHTLGGFVMSYLGRVPSMGDRFEWSGLCFEIVDMDRHRIDKVLVGPVSLLSDRPRETPVEVEKVSSHTDDQIDTDKVV
jgi:putative hemolysin